MARVIQYAAASPQVSNALEYWDPPPEPVIGRRFAPTPCAEDDIVSAGPKKGIFNGHIFFAPARQSRHTGAFERKP